MTYSAWFIDAFNFVMDNDIDIVNLSTASKDTKDNPFIEKIEELTAAGIIVVSAIGNDGPTQGTAESPADMHSVIGVGSLSYNFERVATFSSRGMSKKSMLIGMGVPKPDILLPGEEILGLSLEPGVCKLNRGTSFSVPMLTGSIALVLSAVEKEHGAEYRKSIQNSALVKQAIIKSAVKLKDWSIVEQGAGKFNLNGFYEQIMNLDTLPKVQVYPYALNLTHSSDYFLPFSRQAIYSSMQPFSVELSLSNRMSAHSRIPLSP